MMYIQPGWVMAFLLQTKNAETVNHRCDLSDRDLHDVVGEFQDNILI